VGQRLIPIAEVERFLSEHLEPPREPGERGALGRPPALPRRLVERIRLQYARGRSLADIARALNDEGVPTAHGPANGGHPRYERYSSAQARSQARSHGRLLRCVSRLRLGSWRVALLAGGSFRASFRSALSARRLLAVPLGESSGRR
jgi:hypothetical protein